MSAKANRRYSFLALALSGRTLSTIVRPPVRAPHAIAAASKAAPKPVPDTPGRTAIRCKYTVPHCAPTMAYPSWPLGPSTTNKAVDLLVSCASARP